MSENTSEAQLADQARTALLEGITKAAQRSDGETARGLAEAYAVVTASAPSNSGAGGSEFAVDTYRMSTLKGRR